LDSSLLVKLTTAEHLALSYASYSQQDWIDNAIHERCRVAIEDIVALCVEQCLTSNIQVPGSKDAIVELAFARGWIKSLADVNAEQAAAAPGV
jgi:hypothetical protein